MTMMNDEQAGVADNKTVKPVNREEKKRELVRNQKRTLDLFLERGAISRAQRLGLKRRDGSFRFA